MSNLANFEAQLHALLARGSQTRPTGAPPPHTAATAVAIEQKCCPESAPWSYRAVVTRDPQTDLIAHIDLVPVAQLGGKAK